LFGLGRTLIIRLISQGTEYEVPLDGLRIARTWLVVLCEEPLLNRRNNKLIFLCAIIGFHLYGINVIIFRIKGKLLTRFIYKLGKKFINK